MALALGEAYARLRRETEAVDNLLLAWRRGAAGESAERARRGLTVLAPRLDRLAALKTLADQDDDAALKELAQKRLATQVSTFAELENGAEFLERYPESDQAATVEDRQNRLADDLYKEVILYQRMGDNAKAVNGIHRILTLAPLSPAAKKLGESVVRGRLDDREPPARTARALRNASSRLGARRSPRASHFARLLFDGQL